MIDQAQITYLDFWKQDMEKDVDCRKKERKDFRSKVYPFKVQENNLELVQNLHLVMVEIDGKVYFYFNLVDEGIEHMDDQVVFINEDYNEGNRKTDVYLEVKHDFQKMKVKGVIQEVYVYNVVLMAVRVKNLDVYIALMVVGIDKEKPGIVLVTKDVCIVTDYLTVVSQVV